MASPPSEERRRQLVIASAYILQFIGVATMLYSSPLYWKQDYHTSKLSGAAWVQELLDGHPNRIWTELGIRLHVFIVLAHKLRMLGLKDGKSVGVNEQVAIFLYMCVTGLSIQHVGERFQRSNETISKYFIRVLNLMSSGSFYEKYVRLPCVDDPPSDVIRNEPKFWPFFRNAIGAMDGTHINACPSAAERHAARNRKGGISQNCLACVSFDMQFLYFLSGWGGSTADATMYSHSRLVDLRIPAGKFYLADAGFGICDTSLVPYRGIRYHLAEWGRAGVRPETREELFNLRHASARNVVERIFGVLKKRWAILIRPPQFSLSIQAQVPPALAALHNFIMDYDPKDINEYLTGNPEDDLDPNPGQVQGHEFGGLADAVVTRAEKERATRARDQIAESMWTDYQRILRERE